jgi:hypothetical protein
MANINSPKGQGKGLSQQKLQGGGRSQKSPHSSCTSDSSRWPSVGQNGEATRRHATVAMVLRRASRQWDSRVGQAEERFYSVGPVCQTNKAFVYSYLTIYIPKLLSLKLWHVDSRIRGRHRRGGWRWRSVRERHTVRCGGRGWHDTTAGGGDDTKLGG